MGNMELSWIAEPLMHTYLKLHFLLLKFKRDWMVDEKELRVIHYTLGPLKPWDWWTSWLLKPVDVWQDVRERLWESLLGTRGGQNPNDYFLVKFIFLLPFCALLFCCYHSFMKLFTLMPILLWLKILMIFSNVGNFVLI